MIDSYPSMSVAIMTHPDRLDMATELQAHIGGGIITGVEEKSAWACCRVSYEAHDPNCDYHMVIQDDVGCESTVIEDARYLLCHLPEPAIVSLQDNRLEKDFRWRKASGLNNSRCMIMPTSMINEWLDWDEANVLPDLRPDDIHMTLFAIEHGHPIWFTNPQLVYQKDVWSVFNDAKSTSNSKNYIGGTDIYNIDWDIKNRKEFIKKHKTQGFGVLHEWALGKTIMMYTPEAKFTKPWFLGRKNIVPYEPISVTNTKISTENKAIVLSPFQDVTVPETLLLPKGNYKASGKIMFSHLMEKNTHDDLPDGILKNKNKQVKVGGAGQITLRVHANGEVCKETKVGIFFCTKKKSPTFELNLDEDTEISISIDSSVWGNMAVRFNYSFDIIKTSE